MAGVSVAHLMEGFKASFGTTPWQHVLRTRVAEARRLLEATDLSITAIAVAVGLTPEMLPMIVTVNLAQGAIAIECRDGDTDTLSLLAAIHHEPTAQCVFAERKLLSSLGGGCSLPVGALATWDNGKITLRSFPPEHASNLTL